MIDLPLVAQPQQSRSIINVNLRCEFKDLMRGGILLLTAFLVFLR